MKKYRLHILLTIYIFLMTFIYFAYLYPVIDDIFTLNIFVLYIFFIIIMVSLYIIIILISTKRYNYDQNKSKFHKFYLDLLTFLAFYLPSGFITYIYFYTVENENYEVLFDFGFYIISILISLILYLLLVLGIKIYKLLTNK